MKRQKRQEKPIRQSEKPIRHATGREQAGGRASVQRYQLPRGIVDESHLTGSLRAELSHAFTEAAIVRASKEVWNRAEAITEDGKFLADLIEGGIQAIQLSEDVQGQLASIEDIIARLDSENKELWWSSIKQTYDSIEQTVAVLNLDADHPEQFSSIKQTAGEIESIVTLLEGTPDAAGQFSSIRQTHEQITQVVAMLESDPDDPNQYSAIRQMVDEIDLRVKSEEVITAINLSPEGVRIEGKRLEIDSDTVIVDGSIEAKALKIWDVTQSDVGNQFLGVTMPDGHTITLDPVRGLEMRPQGVGEARMQATGRMLGFWDANSVPAIGLGDVREMASQLGSDMEYGIFIAQGEIRASQSVLEASLTDLGVTRDKLGPGSVDRNKLSPGAVGEQQIQERGIGISRLGEQIQVPLLVKDNMNVLRMEDTSTVRRDSGTAGTWYNIGSALTFPKTDRSRGLLAEALRVVLNFDTGSVAWYSAIRLLINNQTVAEWPYGSFENSSAYILVVYVDARSFPADGQVTVQWQWRRNASTSLSSGYRKVFQNDQLPLRWGAPQYSPEEGTPSGCFGGCQVTCQAACQVTCESGCESSCQSTCESSCQSACEISCQSTCETTSQGGGGCLRDGTPVKIWDEDEQAYRDIPVQDLKPGMILPGYNPATDTLEHGELLELVDARFSNRFLRIHTDIGPSVDVTYSQPFDVLADMGDGERWYKLNARFLQPGMKMVRPFDAEGVRLATITDVENVKENMIQFWNPRTSHGRYTAAGYADQHFKT